MQEIAISEFKAKCLALLEQVRKTKKPIRITRFGKPVAEVVPPSPEAKAAQWLGSMAGRMEIVSDIVSPVFDLSDLEALRDETAPRHTHLDLEPQRTPAHRAPARTRTKRPRQ